MSPATPLNGFRSGGLEYLPVTELAAKIGLKATWTIPRQKMRLADGTRRVDLEAESREMSVDGLRVFLGTPAIVRGKLLYISRIDFERCLRPLIQPQAIGNPPRIPKTIVLDPGHGGTDVGAENKKLKLTEKELTLDLAARLKKLLEAQGYRVVLTRSDDRLVGANKILDLQRRPEIANRENADLFVSLHFNAVEKDARTAGTEVLTFAPQHQRSTDAWGSKTDDAEEDIAVGNHFDAWNSVLANSLHRAMVERMKTEDRGKKIGHLGVLRWLKCPGVLIEPAFLSNDGEAKKLSTSSYRQELARAIADGVKAYAEIVTAVHAQ